MEKEYIIEGMTCQGCVNKVTEALESDPEITDAEVKLSPDSSTIESKEELSLQKLQQLVKKAGNYTISPLTKNIVTPIQEEEKRSWLQTYKPIILIFLFVGLVSSIVSFGQENAWMLFMRYFMAGFFLVFSFFKFLDLKGFASAYQTYDLLAARWNFYGFIYPFIELALGLAYLTAFEPKITYLATVIIMGFSSIGVIQSVMNKQKIKCACLGTVFNLPMSTVTIIEDLLMVIMAGIMLAMA